jgi:hypothetical protein
MLRLARGAVVIGVIFYLSPVRHASHAPEPGRTVLPHRAAAADPETRDDVASRLIGALSRADREGMAGLSGRRLLSVVEAEVTAAARPLRPGKDHTPAGDPAQAGPCTRCRGTHNPGAAAPRQRSPECLYQSGERGCALSHAAGH